MIALDILFYTAGDNAAAWIDAVSKALPEARIHLWSGAPVESARYALVWKPPPELVWELGKTKAVFMAHTLGNPFQLQAVAGAGTTLDPRAVEDHVHHVGPLHLASSAAPSAAGTLSLRKIQARRANPVTPAMRAFAVP